jgi:hypothetical protein
MGIERISGGSAGVPTEEVGGPVQANQASGGFEVARSGEATAPRPVEGGVTPLEQVRSGQIDVATYLDRKVDEATSHLAALPAAQLDAIREALRDRLAVDPSLVELVRAAAGQPPPPPRNH